jgi:hypothetical protein
LINIVVLAGQDSRGMGSLLQAHLNATAQTDYERIGVIGAPGRTLADALGHTMASDRIVLVAPSLLLDDGTRLPSAYTAAAVAGLVKNGFRVLKGLTTAGEGQPFSAIPTRRIVDYATYGVRSAANPYIGRLNNTRVRAALQSTLDAFLTRMVEDEMLTRLYQLSVTATRAQEIAGEVSVVMVLQPTFSIDYIRVTMNLR